MQITSEAVSFCQPEGISELLSVAFPPQNFECNFLVAVLHANLCSMKNYFVCRETFAQIHHKALTLGFKYSSV